MNGQDYLDAARRLEAKEGLDAWTALMRVLVVRLQDMDLPAPLQTTLQQAASHWSGRPADMHRMKVEVWRCIEATWPSGADLATPAGRSARALLCVLEPGGDEEDRSVTAEWFAAMAENQQSAG